MKWGGTFKAYVSSAGDTLIKIAQKYNVSLSDILITNPHISQPDATLTGQYINIPDSSIHHHTHTSIPSCPPLVPPQIIDTWVPLTPLSDMEKNEYDVLIIGTGAGGSAVLWRLCDRLRKSGKRIGIIERGNLSIPTHAYNVPTLGGWGRMLEYWLNPKISKLIGNSLPEFPGAVETFTLGGRTLFWSGTSPRLPPSEFLHWPISYKELEAFIRFGCERQSGTNRGRSRKSRRDRGHDAGSKDVFS